MSGTGDRAHLWELTPGYVAQLSLLELEALADSLPLPDDDDDRGWERYYGHPVFAELARRKSAAREPSIVSRIASQGSFTHALVAGYAHVFDRPKEETIEVREHSGDPDADRDLRVEIDPDDARATRAYLRDDGAGPGSE